MSNKVLYRLGLIAAGVILLASLGGLNARQSTVEAVSISNDDIGWVVYFLERRFRWILLLKAIIVKGNCTSSYNTSRGHGPHT